jgi:hypothetical protein
MPRSLLMVGCSEQLPNELRVYRLVGTSCAGGVLLNRTGATYSATTGEVTPYHEMLEHMLGLVLKNVPSSRRDRMRMALISRWNRDWGVEAEDLDHSRESANHHGSGFPTEAAETYSSPSGPWQRTIDSDGAFEPRAALAAN